MHSVDATACRSIIVGPAMKPDSHSGTQAMNSCPAPGTFIQLTCSSDPDIEYRKL